MPITKIKKKSNLDKFYTKSSVVELCLGSLYPFVSIADLFIEPSAGNGSFVDGLVYPYKIAFDIYPDRTDIFKADWLKIDLIKTDLAIYGNPPFGSRGDLIDSFIKKAIPHSKVIAFVLPLTFRKKTKQKIFPENWKLLSDITLPENSFTLNGKDYHVPTCFQVWGMDIHYSGHDDLRASKQINITTSDFEFVDKEHATHFIFGAAPHKIIEKSLVKSTNRGYYIRTNRETVNRLKQIDWKLHALSGISGGAAWFTKQMIETIYVVNTKYL